MLEEDREFLLLLSRFRRAAADWVASGRASGKLWDRDPQLTYLGSFLMNKPEIFNAAERNFLASSDFRKRVLFPARVFFSIVSILGLVVSVAVTQVNSYHFTVMGAVEHGGYFTSKQYVTAVEAIALAGGPNRFAGNVFYILRGSPQRRIPIDLRRATSGEHDDENLVVMRGDVLVVPQ